MANSRHNRSSPVVSTSRRRSFSPDGRWLAYVSDETGRSEVYVQAFPHLGQKRQISTAGGTNPAWSRNGRKLTFLTRPERPRGQFMQLMELDVTLGANFTATPARPLFEPVFGADIDRAYDMTADASRFIFVRQTYPPSTSAPHELQLVQHCFEELKARAPVR
jgi:eukaryotic-like serine/threonine-protein kinase